MTDNWTSAADRINKAADRLKQLRPVYADILIFHAKLFVTQEESKAQIDLQPVKLSSDMLAIKAREMLPLVAMSDFVVDIRSAEKLLNQICRIIKTFNPAMADSADAIIQAVGTRITTEELFSCLLNADDVYFEKKAEEIGIEKNVLAFMAYNSMKPSLMLCAEQLAGYLTEGREWQQGYCPICGSYPGISTLDSNGKRHLHCSFCWHGWSTARVFCAYCANVDHKSIRYFHSDAEKGYRVDVCDQCQKYMKTVDTRETQHVIYAPLEQVSTLHLDFKAQEMGFESGIQLQLPPTAT